MTNRLSIKSKQVLFSVMATLIIGFIIHGFSFSNLDLSHDSVVEMTGIYDKYLITLGRFCSVLIFKISPLAIPWFNGIVSLIIMGVSFHFIFSFLDIKNRFIKLLTIACILSNRSLIALIATYVEDVICYSLALFFISLALYVIYRIPKYKWFSILIFLISLGIYQAYIQIAAVIIIAKTVSDLLSDRYYSLALKELFANTLIIISSMISYFAIYKLTLFIYGLDEAASGLENSPNNALIVFSADLWNRILNAFQFEVFYISNISGDNSYLGSAFLILLIILGLLLTLSVMNQRKTKRTSAYLIIILCLFLPFATGFILVLANLRHDLIYCSPIYCCLIGAIVVQKYIDSGTDKSTGFQKGLVGSTFIILLCFIFGNFMFANRVYMKKNLEEKTTYALMTRVIDRIEQVDGYIVSETPVVFIGDLSRSPLVTRNEYFDYDGCAWYSSFAITYSIDSYIEKYMNYPMNIQEADAELISGITDELTVFPQSRSVNMIDGTVYVRLSE